MRPAASISVPLKRKPKGEYPIQEGGKYNNKERKMQNERKQQRTEGKEYQYVDIKQGIFEIEAGAFDESQPTHEIVRRKCPIIFFRIFFAVLGST